MISADSNAASGQSAHGLAAALLFLATMLACGSLSAQSLTPAQLDLTALAGEPNPTGALTLAAGSNPLAGITDCGFYDASLAPFAPSLLSLESALPPATLPADGTFDFEFSCNTNSPGLETALYGCSSSSGVFFSVLSCNISQLGEVRGSLETILGSPDATAIGYVQADTDLTNISCQLVDPVNGSDRISLSPGTPVPTSLQAGDSEELEFDCDTSTAGYESVAVSCDSDQGQFGGEANCTVSAVQVEPFYGPISGVAGNAPPTLTITVSAPYAGVDNLSCDFVQPASTLTKAEDLVPATLGAGESATVTISCDTAEAGSEIAQYRCNSGQGVGGSALLECTIRDRYPVEPTPESVQLTAAYREPAPETTVTFSADGSPVTGIGGCGYFRDDSHVSSHPYGFLWADPGAVPTLLGATESFDVTVGCNTNYWDRSENAYYGCNSDQGLFNVPVACVVTPPVAEIYAGVIHTSLGAPPGSDWGQINAYQDLSNLSCGFLDEETGLPSESFSVLSQPPPSEMTGGEYTLLTFQCQGGDAAGVQTALYRCDSDQGSFSAPVDCTVHASGLSDPNPFMSARMGTSAPMVLVDYFPHVNLTNVSCAFESTPTKIHAVSTDVPATMEALGNYFVEFSCDSSSIGYESARYVCDSDQGATTTEVACNIGERYPAEPAPEAVKMSAMYGDPDPQTAVTFTADGSPVTGINGCGFYWNTTLGSPSSYGLFGADAGVIPTALGATDSFEVTLSCNSTDYYDSQYSLYYGCKSDQGIFNLPVTCEVQPPIAETYTTDMHTSLGGSPGSGQVNVLANQELTNLSCGFVEEGSGLPTVPENISLVSEALPSTLAGGDYASLAFQCQPGELAGPHIARYRCETDQGAFSAPVQCDVHAAVVNRHHEYLDGVQGNPAPSLSVGFTPLVLWSAVSCDFDSPPSIVRLDASSIPTDMNPSESAFAEFSCDTNTAGYETARYTCDSDQGPSWTEVTCDIRERFAVEPEPLLVSLYEPQGAPEPTQAVTFTAQAAEVTNINSCDFYSGSNLGNVNSATNLFVQSGGLPSGLAPGESVDLTFACDTSSPAYSYTYYGCDSDQGPFYVEAVCYIYVSDLDGDGYADASDNCPGDYQTDQSDIDGDGLGDVCDDDRDGDGLSNAEEQALGTLPDNPDTDGDGVNDGDEVQAGTSPTDKSDCPLPSCQQSEEVIMPRGSWRYKLWRDAL